MHGVSIAFLEQALTRGIARYRGPEVKCDVPCFEVTSRAKQGGYVLSVRPTGGHTRYAARALPKLISFPVAKGDMEHGQITEDGYRAPRGSQYLSFNITERLSGGGYFVAVNATYMTQDGKTETVEAFRFKSELNRDLAQQVRVH